VNLPTGAQFPSLLEVIETPENGPIAPIKPPESFIDTHQRSIALPGHPLGGNLLKER
jgi:hypothetical protein